MTDRSYLSIGDVLSLLKEEFPDVTISKIRFLESQGLLDPERTPSGYRKFYPPDVERLRWILQQQKEHFLPLKVIKDRLEPGGGTEEAQAGAAGTSTASIAVAPDSSGTGPEGTGVPLTPPDAVPEEARAPVAVQSPGPTVVRPVRSSPRAIPTDADQLSLTLDELLESSGLDGAELRELERFGLIAGRTVAGTVYYDGDAAAVAQLAGELGRYGVEARHLRMYKTAAEREAGFFEQIVTPLLKQRNPRSRQEAVDTVYVLSALGERLRRALLRMALRDLTGP
jgi:DNA-binding transcriptional MerR regulator